VRILAFGACYNGANCSLTGWPA